MGITKKAISLGTTAALLASLAAVVVAPAAAFADTSVTSAGSVPAGGTSAGTATFVFNDDSTFVTGGSGGFCHVLGSATSGTLTVTLTDSAAQSTISFVGTPVVTAPSSLGASAAISTSGVSGASNDVLTVTITGCDPNNPEQVTVSGLKLAASTSAATGAITATLGGTLKAAVATSVTATGTLASYYPSTSTSLVVNVTSTAHFAAGTATINGTATPHENVTISSVSTSGTQDTLTLSAGTANPYPYGTPVSETISNFTGLSSPGTVAASVTQNASTPKTVFPGQNNQAVADTTVTENSAGALAAGAVLTFTLPAGVTFSNAPAASAAQTGSGFALSGGNSSNTCALSYDLKSCSVTVSTASTSGVATVTISSISVDVAASVANGSSVTMTLSTSVPVNVTSNVVAYVNRVIVGVGALPTVYIGYNGQNTGLITVTESAAGFFQAGSGGNNQFEICIANGSGDQFMFAPWAIVTSGDLKLLNTSTLLGVTSVAGSLTSGNSCATWYVYSGSTVASTISIVGANASGALPVAAGNGPTLSVSPSDQPGSVQMTVTTGAGATPTYSTTVTNAIRAFKSGVVVAAASQPFIAPGTTGAAGNITISETLNGQLVADEDITCQVLNSAFNQNQQVYLSAANSNMLPVVSTNTTTGLIAHFVSVNSATNSFTLHVDQQAVAPGLGTITVSNLNYTVVSGTTNGSVYLDCFNGTFTPEFLYPLGYRYPTLLGIAPYTWVKSPSIGTAFDQYVSNAVIGSPAVKGKVVISAFGSGGTTYSISSQVLARGQKLTVTFKTSPKLAGERLGIWLEVRQRGATSFGPFSPHTSITLDYNGVGTYTYVASSGVKIGLSGRFLGNDTLMPATSYPTIFGLFQ